MKKELSEFFTFECIVFNATQNLRYLRLLLVLLFCMPSPRISSYYTRKRDNTDINMLIFERERQILTS